MSKTNSLFSDLLDNLDEKLKWHQLPKFLGLVGLLKFRNIYREKNLFDTEDPPFQKNPNPEAAPQEKVKYRAYDGSFNDLQYPKMGVAGGTDAGPAQPV